MIKDGTRSPKYSISQPRQDAEVQRRPEGDTN